jgi:PAS domain S-box-containing protein
LKPKNDRKGSSPIPLDNRTNSEILSEKNQAHGVMRESQEDYRLLVEHANEAILIAQEGMLKFVNPKAEAISGYSAQELTSRPFLEFVHPEDREMIKDYYVRRIRGEEVPVVYEFRIIHKQGEVLWLRNNVVVLHWMGEPATLNLIMDITLQKKNEARLKETEELLSNAFGALHDLLLVIDRDLRIVKSNWKGLEHFPREERGEKPYCYAVTMNRQAPCDPCHALEVFETGKPRELEVCSPFDGRIREIRALPIFDGAGNVVMVVEHLRDITSRKQAEEHIEALTQQLLRAQENERQIISRELHDRLAQELTSVKIGLDTLFDQHHGVPPSLREKLSDFSKTLQRSIMSVRDLSYDLRPPALDDLGLVQAVSQYCQDFSEKSGVRVEFFSAGVEKMTLDFDTEINLYRMVQEGLNNIQKHAEAANATVRLVASFPHIILRIEDDGKGFDVEQRLASLTEEKRMGLRSIEERVKLLQGRIKIRSSPGMGTTILIEIPWEAEKDGSQEGYSDH